MNHGRTNRLKEIDEQEKSDLKGKTDRVCEDETRRDSSRVHREERHRKL